MNEVLCTLFAVKVACNHDLLPKDFEQIQQIQAVFFVYKNEQVTKTLSDIEDIWETINNRRAELCGIEDLTLKSSRMWGTNPPHLQHEPPQGARY
ncbi:MAG: hypothetical protein LBH43_19690 [Treponema sp.]|jgi:hypothetical protein|nr:hypothetical protein [Treponema sp.]